MLPDDIGCHRPAWILREYRRALQAQWEALVDQAHATELGVSRALAVALGGKRLPPLPGFEEVLAQARRRRLPRAQRLPAWMVAYERVNADRITCG